MDMGLPLATGHGANAAAARRLCLRVRGQVQGVGFRPHVWRPATRDKLTGFALNDQEGVLLEVQGTLMLSSAISSRRPRRLRASMALSPNRVRLSPTNAPS